MFSADTFIADVKRKLEAASTIDAQELRDRFEREEAARYAGDDDEGDDEDEDEEYEDEDDEDDAGEDGEDGDGGSNGEDDDDDEVSEEVAEVHVAADEEAADDGDSSDEDAVPERKQAWEPRDGVHDQLCRCIVLVQSIEQEKEQGHLSEAQFTELIDFAGARINALFDQYYSERDFTDIEVKLFATENAVKIKQRFYVMTTKSFQSFVSIMGKYMIKEMNIEDAWNSKVLARPWLTTSRPSPQSNLLARFNPDYDHDKIDAICDSIEDPTQRDKAEALFQARASFFDESITAPHCMAIGENVLVIGGAGGYKRREDRLSFRPIESEPVETDQWDFDIIKTIGTGMAQPGSQVVYDSATQLVWHDGDDRIKAFGLNRKVKYTLDSSDYQGQFAVIDNGATVIRGGKEDFAVWKIDQLTEHAKGVIPGGRLIPEDDEKIFGWLEEGASRSMERSVGDAPQSKFTIGGITPPDFGHATLIPGTSSRYLFAPTAVRSRNTKTTVYSVDLGQASPVAHVVGIGHGLPVTSLSAHAALPNLYVTTCADNYGRVYDVRHPLPQLVLECSIYPMHAAAIAPNAGIAPLFFTGGSDGLVRAWDVRHTRACLYELSAAVLDVDALAWHERQQSLFVAGARSWDAREHIDTDPGRPPILGERETWPKNARYDPDYFGRRYYAGQSALLEYRFRTDAAQLNIY